jgi:hypothetical protein
MRFGADSSHGNGAGFDAWPISALLFLVAPALSQAILPGSDWVFRSIYDHRRMHYGEGREAELKVRATLKV